VFFSFSFLFFLFASSLFRLSLFIYGDRRPSRAVSPGRAKADLIARAADTSIAVPRPFVLLISQQIIAKYLPSLAVGAA